MNDYLNVNQVWLALNRSISKSQIYRLIQRGKLRSNTKTGRILVEKSSLEELMEGTIQKEESQQTSKKPAGISIKRSGIKLW